MNRRHFITTLAVTPLLGWLTAHAKERRRMIAFVKTAAEWSQEGVNRRLVMSDGPYYDYIRIAPGDALSAIQLDGFIISDKAISEIRADVHAKNWYNSALLTRLSPEAWQTGKYHTIIIPVTGE